MRDYCQLPIETLAELHDWLARNHGQREPVWLVTLKKAAAGDAYIPYDAIVEECLCFGWIDSLPRKLDFERTMLLISPRKPGSAWSKPNRDRVERLIAAKRMRAEGLRMVEQAKADGSWDFLRDAEAGLVPPDLARSLEGRARTNFDAFSGPTRRRLIEWVARAKRAETRQKRIEAIAAGAHANRDPLMPNR